MEPKQIADIRQLGALAYTPEQVAQVMGLDAEAFAEWTRDPDNEAGNAYWAGWYETDIANRKSIVDLAARGSNPAQIELRKMMEAAEARRYYGN